MKNFYVKPQMTKTEVATENAILVGSVFNQEGNHIQLSKHHNAFVPAKEGKEEVVNTMSNKPLF